METEAEGIYYFANLRVVGYATSVGFPRIRHGGALQQEAEISPRSSLLLEQEAAPRLRQHLHEHLHGRSA